MSDTQNPRFDLIGQPHPARLLEAALRSGPSHAYLFAGPAGVGKRSAARQFAAALCCQDDGCGVCPGCVKAARGLHPDIVTIEPAGSVIMVDQIRDINRSLILRPHESRARVFIVSDAGSLGAEGANAFLKSLEEPPPFVYFLLVASRPDRVLPTIASRCQLVRFGQIAAAEMEEYLMSRCHVSATMATAAARVCGGNLALAESLLLDAELAARRERYLSIAATLCRGAWEGGAAGMAAEIEAAASLIGEAAGAAEESVPDGFEAAPSKTRKQEAHRRAGAAQKRELVLALGILASWFRDMLVTAAGASGAILNTDYENELEDLALPSRIDSYRQALAAVENARRKLGYNVDLGLILQAMFYELMEVL